MRSIPYGCVLLCVACTGACGGRVVFDDSDPDVISGGASGLCGAAGDPVVIAEGLAGPAYITVDAQNLYFAESNVVGDRLLRLPKGGGEPVTLAPGMGTNGIVVDEASVYWVVYDNQGSVNRVPKEGGAVEMLASTPRGTELVQDDTNIYWLGTGSLSSGYVDGVVMKLPKSGGPAVTLASNLLQLGSLSVASELVYWTHLVVPVGVGGEDAAAGELVRMPKTGGAASIVFEGNNVSGLATDDEWVYWTAASADSTYPNDLWRAPHAGGTPELLVETPAFAWTIHVDDSCIYFIDGAGSVQRVDKEGGSPTKIADLDSRGARLATDDSTVFVTDYEGGYVWAIPK